MDKEYDAPLNGLRVWIDEATTQQIEDHLAIQEVELEDIRIQLESDRYLNDKEWAIRARRASNVKRGQIKQFKKEIELRKQSNKKKTKEESKQKHFNEQVELVKQKYYKKVESIKRSQEERIRLVRILRGMVGERLFKEAAERAKKDID